MSKPRHFQFSFSRYMVIWLWVKKGHPKLLGKGGMNKTWDPFLTHSHSSWTPSLPGRWCLIFLFGHGEWTKGGLRNGKAPLCTTVCWCNIEVIRWFLHPTRIGFQKLPKVWLISAESGWALLSCWLCNAHEYSWKIRSELRTFSHGTVAKLVLLALPILPFMRRIHDTEPGWCAWKQFSGFGIAAESGVLLTRREQGNHKRRAAV